MKARCTRGRAPPTHPLVVVTGLSPGRIAATSSASSGQTEAGKRWIPTARHRHRGRSRPWYRSGRGHRGAARPRSCVAPPARAPAAHGSEPTPPPAPGRGRVTGLQPPVQANVTPGAASKRPARPQSVSRPVGRAGSSPDGSGRCGRRLPEAPALYTHDTCSPEARPACPCQSGSSPCWFCCCQLRLTRTWKPNSVTHCRVTYRAEGRAS